MNEDEFSVLKNLEDLQGNKKGNDLLEIVTKGDDELHIVYGGVYDGKTTFCEQLIAAANELLEAQAGRIDRVIRPLWWDQIYEDSYESGNTHKPMWEGELPRLQKYWLNRVRTAVLEGRRQLRWSGKKTIYVAELPYGTCESALFHLVYPTNENLVDDSDEIKILEDRVIKLKVWGLKGDPRVKKSAVQKDPRKKLSEIPDEEIPIYLRERGIVVNQDSISEIKSRNVSGLDWVDHITRESSRSLTLARRWRELTLRNPTSVWLSPSFDELAEEERWQLKCDVVVLEGDLQHTGVPDWEILLNPKQPLVYWRVS